MFWAEIRKITYTPANPSFTILKWGLRGSKLYRHVFVMSLVLVSLSALSSWSKHVNLWIWMSLYVVSKVGVRKKQKTKFQVVTKFHVQKTNSEPYNTEYWDRQAWANSVDQGQMAKNAAPDQGPHFLSHGTTKPTIWPTMCPAKTQTSLYILHITKTYLYNSDPLKPNFYIVKLGFTGVYFIFLISA